MNRNVSIWRGNEFPPTTKHVWIDDENNFLLHDGSGWKIVTNTDGNDNGYFPEVIVWNHTNNMNDFINSGTYKIEGERTRNDDNLPIMNQGVISARLEVFETKSNNNKVITQILNLNNNAGGEGNIYTRSCQNGTWNPWGKLQTNVDVGQITPDDMSNLIDNGIYSGVCVDGATVETFVLIVINNYLASTQAGFGGYISQLKYAIDLNRGNTVKTRTRDAYGIWSEWENIGGSSTLPEATVDTIGGVKLGMVRYNNYTPLVNINQSSGNGVGIKIDSSVLMNSGNGLKIRYDDSLTIESGQGLSVRLGTSGFLGSIIPCVLGTSMSLGYAWNNHSIGIPYNPEQFCLKNNGLNLKNDIGSAGDLEEIGGGNNYLGLKSLTELKDNKTIKSGTYYGLLSDHNNRPFILEVTTNFDTNSVDDKEKLGLKRLLVGTTGNNHIEYISIGLFRNISFRYNTFTRKNDIVSCNRFENLSNAYSSTMIITKFDDSITIPASYSVLYNHIMNTAKNISNIASVTIKTSPGEYQQDSGSLLFDSIIEVVYSRKQGMYIFPYKYEKLVLDIGIPSKIFVIQPLIELQELE